MRVLLLLSVAAVRGAPAAIAMYFFADTVRGYPTLVTRTRLGWDQAECTTYRFSGTAYVVASRRVEREPTRDSLGAVLESIPW